MKSFKLLLASLAFSFVLFTGCQKDIKTEPTATAPELQQAGAVKKTTDVTEASKEKLTKLIASLPAGAKEKLAKKVALTVQAHPQYRALVLKALHATDPSTCNDYTAISQWLNGELSDWTYDAIINVLSLAMLDLPQDYALLFQNSSENQYYGVDGEFTHQVTKTFKDIKRFWNIQSDDIILAAMHGNIMQDRDKVIKTYMYYFGIDNATAQILADIVVESLKVFPEYRNGDHPIFTFNAFAFPRSNGPLGIIPSKIIMGDGIMEGFDAIGYGDVAPQAILAHEFGHHIQFQLNLFEDVRTPEATRRTELMADAYAAYYLSHARGASMQWKRVKQFLAVFFNIGDCSFNSTGHHGTPTQRMAAAEWGYSVANNAQKQGHILTAQQFTALFEAQLPQIVAQ